MMKKIIIAIFFSLFTTIFTQQRYTIYMVLWRGITDAEKGFMNYLRKHKIPVKFIIKNCNKNKGKLPQIVEDIKQVQPDLVYTFGTTVTTHIAGTKDNYNNGNFINKIPIVFNIVADPIGAKLVESLKSSHRNITGTSHLVPIISQVKAMLSIIKVKKLGIIYNSQERNSTLAVALLEKIAYKFNFKIEKISIPLDKFSNPMKASIPLTVKSLINRKVDIIYIPSDSFLISNAKLLVLEINKYNIPTFSATEGPIRKAGALMGLVSRYYNVGQFAAYKASLILMREKQPKDIPIETLKRFSFIMNLETIKKLHFYPPLNIIKFAEFIK